MSYGQGISILYRATAGGKLVNDDVKNHTVIGYSAGVPTPIKTLKAAALDGYFVATIPPTAMQCNDFSLAIVTKTPGILLDVLPVVTTVRLPKVDPGEQGGLLIVGEAPGCLNPRNGNVAVHAIGDGAIQEGSFAQGAISSGVVAKGIIGPDSFGDGLLSALATYLISHFKDQLVQDGVFLPRVRLKTGDQPGELRISQGVVEAKPTDKTGYSLDERTLKTITAEVGEMLLKLAERLGELAKGAHITRIADIVQDALNQYRELHAHAANQHDVNIAALKLVQERLSQPVRAHVTQLGENPAALETLVKFLTTGADLQSTLKGVEEVTQPVKLAEGQAVDVESLGGSKELVTRLLESITDDGNSLNIFANLKGTVADACLSPETLTTIVDAVFDKLKLTAVPELSGVPAANSPLTDKITWLFMVARNAIETEGTTQRLRGDSGKTTVASRQKTNDGTRQIDQKWGA